MNPRQLSIEPVDGSKLEVPMPDKYIDKSVP